MKLYKDSKETIDRVIILSGLSKDVFCNEVLGIKPNTYKAKSYANHVSFSPAEVDRALSYAEEHNLWDEKGFKFKTDDLILLWKVVLEFTLLPMDDLSNILGVSIPKLYKYRRKANKTAYGNETKKLLKLAHDHKLRISFTHISEN